MRLDPAQSSTDLHNYGGALVGALPDKRQHGVEAVRAEQRGPRAPTAAGSARRDAEHGRPEYQLVLCRTYDARQEHGATASVKSGTGGARK